METPIFGLRGSITHRLSVEVYLRHQTGEAGRCARCGQRVPCPARLHSERVIEASGEDPSNYMGHSSVASTGEPWPRRTVDDERRRSPAGSGIRLPDNVTGYALGGIGRRSDLPLSDEWER